MNTEREPAGFTQFDYLLNALEVAGHAEEPAKADYGAKRNALYAYVRDLEARAAPQPAQAEPQREALAEEAHKARRAACGAWSDIMSGKHAVLPMDFEERCDKAQAAEKALTEVIDRLAALPAPHVPTADVSCSSDPTAVVEARERSSGREAPNVGNYVLATKYCDGDPGDAWALGFYTGTVSDRHMVRDNSGKNIRPSGYRRVGRITEEFGHWLWNNREVLESSPPGTVNLWGMLGSFATPREDFTPPRFEARTTEAQHRQDGQEPTSGQQGEEGKT